MKPTEALRVSRQALLNFYYIYKELFKGHPTVNSIFREREQRLWHPEAIKILSLNLLKIILSTINLTDAFILSQYLYLNV